LGVGLFTVVAASVVWAAAFAGSGDIVRFLSRYGTVDKDGKPRRACVCRNGNTTVDGLVGIVDFKFDTANINSVGAYWRYNCAIPHVDVAGAVNGYLNCGDVFDVLE
jgi:hypothetical protein